MPFGMHVSIAADTNVPLAYDIFGFTWAKEPIQCVAGLMAAIIA